MSHKSDKKHHPYCLNCHYPLSEFDKNCSQCGQKPTDGKTTMHDLIHEFVHTLFHLDGKFFWTLKHLFVPAKLTQEFFKGHHKRYAHPIQLFLVLGALTFGTIVSKSSKAEVSINKSIEQNKKNVYREEMLEELKNIHLQEAPQYSPAQRQILDTTFVRFKNKLVSGSATRTTMTINEAGINFSSSKEIDKKEEKDLESENANERASKDSIDNKLDSSTFNPVRDFVDGFKSGVKKGNRSQANGKNALDEPLKELVEDKVPKNNPQNDPYYLPKDSSKLFGFTDIGKDKRYDSIRISRQEMYGSNEDSIIKKYKIEGFWSILHAKQNLKMKKNGASFFHQIMSKLIYVTLLLIPILALVFLGLFRRPKKYYVEHVVFLLHYNTTVFVGIILMFWIYPFWHGVVGFFFLWAATHFFLSLKFYYQQGIGKTFLKFSIIGFSYLFLAVMVIALNLVVSFFLF